MNLNNTLADLDLTRTKWASGFLRPYPFQAMNLKAMVAFGAYSWKLDNLPLRQFVSCLMLADEGPSYNAWTKRNKDNTNCEENSPYDPIEGECHISDHEHRHSE